MMLLCVCASFSMVSLNAEDVSEKGLTEKEAQAIQSKFVAEKIKAAQSSSMAQNAKKNKVVKDDLNMNYTLETFGSKPKEGWPAVISLHGGGTCPKPINDQQWKNQQHRYRNAMNQAKVNCLYVTPRAPRDVEPWHPYFFKALSELISQLVLCNEVDPNRIYVMGYSEGGYCCFRIMPSFIDRLAAIAPGGACDNPDLAPAENLMNIYFNMQLGQFDNGFKRITFAREYAKQLTELQKKNKGLYNFSFTEHKGFPHDCPDYHPKYAAIPQMLKHKRNPYPKQLVWNQGGWVPAQHFYWVSVDTAQMEKNKRLTAAVEAPNVIHVQTKDYTRFTLWLDDALVNLDKEVTVKVNQKQLFKGKVKRTEKAIKESYDLRGDLGYLSPAKLEIEIK